MNEKLNEKMMLSEFEVGAELLRPLVIRKCALEDMARGRMADARIEVGVPGVKETFRFVVESKSRATPQFIRLAIATAKAAARGGEWPMIQVPFLTEKWLEELEGEGVSGVDLCGNGVVIVPGRLLVVRSGKPNKYPDLRPVNNPYSGRSGMVARMFLTQPRWESLNMLCAAVQRAGSDVSLGQASKATKALAEDLIITKSGGVMTLREPLQLLDKLGGAWRKPLIRSKAGVRLRSGADWAGALSSGARVKWAVTGESSVSRYATFSQGGPKRIAVSSIARAMSVLEGTPEPVPNFADIELLETEEPGFYFDTETDENGIRWASRLQTWLELQAGDGRQREAARDIRLRILKGDAGGRDDE